MTDDRFARRKAMVADLDAAAGFERVDQANVDWWWTPSRLCPYGLENAHAIWRAKKGLEWWQKTEESIADALAKRLTR